ncbi:hypothetical protein GCM10011491_41470 [Brucella endophytica]|uniref:DUF6884 domain-containing protein n=1 Tax=Brucella endophytica TaxID=1963359 RepID=A0A916SPF7_9HYPH|nr:DUF6884 domain-containing protein [Brucella endophytica]GGB09213.1 hypothetical protein GCM10011491_41470 [Brucella endophytica]
MTGIFLVSCVKQKRSEAAPAASLYISDWFRKARAYVEDTGLPWFILSAEHGLLNPAQVIEPYERTLADMRAIERRAWGDRVIEQIKAEIGPAPLPLIFLAGRLYREPLAAWAGSRAVVPMQGLGIGQQKAWLTTKRHSL